MKLSLLAVLVFIASSCFSSTVCQTTYTTSNGAKVQFCITENGNVINFEGPPGWKLINQSEGYGLCADSGASYYDIGDGGESGNWNPSMITQPHGPNTFPLTIARQTTDGQFSLTQTFTLGGGGKSLIVKMKVIGQQRGTLIRFAEVAKHEYPQQGGHTSSSSFVWSDGIRGLMLKPTGATQAGVTASGAQNPCTLNGQGLNFAIWTQWPTGVTQKGSDTLEYVSMR